MIGHELTHGFDDSGMSYPALPRYPIWRGFVKKNTLYFLGKNYDEDGRREDWWTDHTLNEFKKRSKCLVDQYSRYQFHGRNVS